MTTSLPQPAANDNTDEYIAAVQEARLALRRQEELPKGAHAISTGLERTSVPMEEKRPAGSPPTTRRKKRTKPYVRRGPPPVDVRYRQAYVGTVSIVDQNGEALVGIMQDGAPEMWNLMRTAVKAAGVRRWHEGVDRYHLNERLGEILRIVEPDEAKRSQRVGRWNDELDRDDGGHRPNRRLVGGRARDARGG